MKINKYENSIDDEIDLHGYYVSEALEYLELFLIESKNNKYKTVRIITGKGSHSPGAETPIRDAVINYLENKYQWSFDKSTIGPNSGAIIVKLKN
jgi:DNA-nicking Smr family endonuclease